MKRVGRKSDCPINFALEVFGDSWSLLILRDIVFVGKKTYGEFLESRERIATNVLATRLELLERKGILHKTPHPKDNRKDLYTLSEKGLDLIPIAFEMMSWGVAHDPKAEKPAVDFIKRFHRNKSKLIKEVTDKVRAGGSVFSFN